MLFFFPFIILLLMAYVGTLIAKIRISEALFLSIAIIMISSLLCSFLHCLKINAYTFAILTIISALILTFTNINKGTLREKLLNRFFQIELLLFLSVVFICFILFKHTYIQAWDDFYHWGLSARSFYMYDGIPTSTAIDVQTKGFPLLNVFILNLSTYSESHLLIAQQIFLSIIALLPFSNVKWKNYKSVLAYAFIIISLNTYAMNYSLNLYNDVMLSVLGAGIISYYYLSENKTSKKTQLIITSGLFMMTQTKRVMGLFISLMIISIIIFDLFKHRKMTSKKLWKFASFLLSAPLISHLIHTLIMRGHHVQGAISSLSDMHWNNMISSLFATIQSPIGIILLLFTALSITLALSTFFRRKRSWPFLLFSLIFVSALFLSVMIRFDSKSLELIEVFIKNVVFTNIYGIPFYKLFVLGTILFTMFYYIAINPIYRRRLIQIAGFFIVSFTAYLSLLLVSYSVFFEFIAMTTGGLERYIRGFIEIFILTFIIFTLFKKDFVVSLSLQKTIILTTLLIALIWFFPKPFTYLSYQKSESSSSICDEIRTDTAAISSDISKDTAIYLVAQGDSNYVRNAAVYYFQPATVKKLGNRAGGESMENAWPPEQLSVESLSHVLKSGGFDYLYIYFLDDYFIETYQRMFQSIDDIQSHAVFKISFDSNNEATFTLLTNE